jgi:hypothetical protein
MRPSGKRLVLGTVAVLLSGAAALAIGILLFGDFGTTEGRILASTALLAGYGLLTLPAAILQDRRRLPLLAAAVAALAAAAAATSLAAVWQHDPSEIFGKTIGTLTCWLFVATQASALWLRRGEQDPPAVRRLFAASCVVACALAVVFTVLLWGEIDSELVGRIIGSLVVLDALLVALQPIFARARPATSIQRLRLVVAPDETVELSVEARDAAEAVSRAMRSLEREGRRVVLVELVDERRRPAGSLRRRTEAGRRAEPERPTSDD